MSVIFFSISAPLLSQLVETAHKRVCVKQRADTKLLIENFNFSFILDAILKNDIMTL